MMRIVAAVAEAATSTGPSRQPEAMAVAAPAKVGISRSIAAGAKLAATIRRWSRQSSPSDDSRPLPIVRRSSFLTMSGFT